MVTKKTSKIKKTEKIPKVKKVKEVETTVPAKKERYFEAVGRRKTAVARVRLYTKKTGLPRNVHQDALRGLEVNNFDFQKYFPIKRLQNKAFSPLEKMKISDKLGAVVKVKGGGISAQAEAIALGISRALTKFNPDFKKRLRRFGHLTRNSRVVERKKYGLKKARRAPQWKKR